MTAVILAFPASSPIRCSSGAGADASPLTPGWCAQHLPLIDAAMDLLEADDAEFARRCRTMRDEDSRALLDELAGQLQRLGAHIADVADALGLTAARIRDQMAAPAFRAANILEAERMPIDLKTIVDKANAVMETLTGSSVQVRQMVERHDVVIGVWQDPKEEGGVGTYIVKGQRALMEIAKGKLPRSSGQPSPVPALSKPSRSSRFAVRRSCPDIISRCVALKHDGRGLL